MTAGIGTVLPPSADEVRSEPQGVDEPWWMRAPELLHEVEQRPFVRRASGAYRFGDAILRMDVDDPAILAGFPRFYGECAVSDATAPELATVRCTLRRSRAPQLVVLTFHEGAPADPAAAAYNLLRPTQAVPPFRVWDSPLPGWRLAGGSTGPVLAACGDKVLLHPLLIPPEFLAELLVGLTLGDQPGMLPVHGASLQMGDAGIVLIGGSHAGKTTTSLHLAAAGHTLLGDEIALIRLASQEIVPFRRAVNVRPGRYGRELAAILGLTNGDAATAEAPWSGAYRIAALFPERPARPTRLRGVFFLGGFADRPSLERFSLSLEHRDVFSWITTPEIAYCSWGVAPERRAFRLMVLQQVLARVPCWLLKVGRPRDTVALIERTVEEL